VHTRVKDILENENKMRIDNMSEIRVFNIGDKVFLHDNTTKVGLSRKLTKRWKGPFTIIERNSNVTYTIEKDGNTQLVSIHRLRLAGDQEKNSYLDHEEDLVNAQSELTSINDSIQHLLQLKTEKEKEKSLLNNAIIHDKSVIDEHGQVIQPLTVINEAADVTHNDIQNKHHINTLKISNDVVAYELSSREMRAMWC